MGSLLGYALSKGLAENSALALQMAAEPAALLAGDPVAFFMGKATDTTESFVKAVMQSGFGSGDESVETSILTQFAQVCLSLATAANQMLQKQHCYCHPTGTQPRQSQCGVWVLFAAQCMWHLQVNACSLKQMLASAQTTDRPSTQHHQQHAYSLHGLHVTHTYLQATSQAFSDTPTLPSASICGSS